MATPGRALAASRRTDDTSCLKKTRCENLKKKARTAVASSGARSGATVGINLEAMGWKIHSGNTSPCLAWSDA